MYILVDCVECRNCDSFLTVLVLLLPRRSTHPDLQEVRTAWRPPWVRAPAAQRSRESPTRTSSGCRPRIRSVGRFFDTPPLPPPLTYKKLMSQNIFAF